MIYFNYNTITIVPFVYKMRRSQRFWLSSHEFDLNVFSKYNVRNISGFAFAITCKFCLIYDRGDDYSADTRIPLEKWLVCMITGRRKTKCCDFTISCTWFFVPKFCDNMFKWTYRRVHWFW